MGAGVRAEGEVVRPGRKAGAPRPVAQRPARRDEEARRLRASRRSGRQACGSGVHARLAEALRGQTGNEDDGPGRRRAGVIRQGTRDDPDEDGLRGHEDDKEDHGTKAVRHEEGPDDKIDGFDGEEGRDINNEEDRDSEDRHEENVRKGGLPHDDCREEEAVCHKIGDETSSIKEIRRVKETSSVKEIRGGKEIHGNGEALVQVISA